MNYSKLGAYIVILIMASSSMAFVINSFSSPQSDQPNTASYVVNRKLPAEVERELLSKGFTILEYHYSDESDPLLQYVSGLPQENDNQIFVELITSGNNKATLTSFQNNLTIENPTQEKIGNALCQVLVMPPSYCGLTQ